MYQFPPPGLPFHLRLWHFYSLYRQWGYPLWEAAYCAVRRTLGARNGA